MVYKNRSDDLDSFQFIGHRHGLTVGVGQRARAQHRQIGVAALNGHIQRCALHARRPGGAQAPPVRSGERVSSSPRPSACLAPRHTHILTQQTPCWLFPPLGSQTPHSYIFRVYTRWRGQLRIGEGKSMQHQPEVSCRNAEPWSETFSGAIVKSPVHWSLCHRLVIGHVEGFVVPPN